jgi:hypothetical protein
MGWTFLHEAREKQQVIEACVKSSATLKCVKKAVHGNHLWTIFENSVTKSKSIVLFLLAKSQGCWGYKDMTEHMGPHYYDCPVSFLDEVPEPDSPYSAGWREGVRTYHAKEKERRTHLKNLAVGSMIKLMDGYKPNVLRVTSLNPLRGTSSEGDLYRIPKTRIAEVM